MKSIIPDSFKTYYWQIISFCLRFFSLFVVTPFISENKTIFGVYALCISVIIFFNYADLGFLRAAAKFCAEKVRLNDIDSEIKIMGFSGFVLLIFGFVIMSGLSVFIYNPTLIISNLENYDDIIITKNLFAILLFSSPIYLILRIIQTIYEARIKSYIYNRAILFSSFFTILSAYYFFGFSNYDIIGYFLSIQFFNFIVLVYLLYVLKNKFDYPLIFLLRSFKFSKKYYDKIKKIAYSSFLLSITWIFFIELDSLFIIKKFGAEDLALFTISLTFFTLFRFIFSTIFTPINTNMNYLVVDKNKDSLKKYVRKLFLLSPVFMLPTFSAYLFSENFIKSWVGVSFTNSIYLAEFFSLFYFFGFFSFISGSYLLSISKLKILNINSLSLPLFFWISIYFINYHENLTVENFVLSKFLIFVISNILMGIYVIRLLKLNLKKIVLENKYVLLSLIILYLFDVILEDFFPNSKSFFNLLITIIIIILSFIFSLIPILISKPHKKEIINIINSLKNQH